jgi:hypothetical protein
MLKNPATNHIEARFSSPFVARIWHVPHAKSIYRSKYRAFKGGRYWIEPVTPTVSMLSPGRWLRSLTLETLNSGTPHVGWRGWRWSLTVAAWPPRGPRNDLRPAVRVTTQHVRQIRSHAPIQRFSYAIVDRRPSIVLETLLTMTPTLPARLPRFIDPMQHGMSAIGSPYVIRDLVPIAVTPCPIESPRGGRSQGQIRVKRSGTGSGQGSG